MEQGDSALETTTTTVSDIATVGLQGASTEGLESMSTEVAGPVTTHPQLLPEGLADPFDSSIASEGQITADSATATATTGSNERVTSRQPPIAAEVTAAAFPSPTHVGLW